MIVFDLSLQLATFILHLLTYVLPSEPQTKAVGSSEQRSGQGASGVSLLPPGLLKKARDLSGLCGELEFLTPGALLAP